MTMSEPPPESPAPGWYPDPNGSGGQRWWDGAGWSEHVAPGVTQSDWGATPRVPTARPTGEMQPTTAMPGAIYGGYVPQLTPLTPSGMRPLAALFSDVGRILRRAWLPIVGVSLVIWIAWSALMIVATALVLDLGNLSKAIETTSGAPSDYPSGEIPLEVQTEISEAWRSVPRTDSVWPWVVLAVLVILATILAAVFQSTAVAQLGIDAASGQPAHLSEALRSGLPAAFRLAGYVIAMTLVILIVVLVWGFLFASAIASGGVQGAVLGAASFLALMSLMVLMTWALVRLIPVLVQVLMGGGAISWSWQATKGKFWAVLGRYALWSLVASLVVQLAVLVIMIPAYVLIVGSAASGNQSWILGSTVVLLLLVWPASMVASSITYVGVIPIWRDLTDDPTYRSIGPDGIPLPEPVAPAA